MPHLTKRRLGKIWALLLILTLVLELVLVLATEQVRAQGTATPGQTGAAGATGTSAATGTPAPTGTTAPAGAQASGSGGGLSSLKKPPNGSDSETVHLYYDYIFANYLQQQGQLRTQIRWSGVFWIFFWLITLGGFFYLYAAHFSHVHREHGELYGIVSFAGSILERIGAVSLFNKVVWTATVLAALYFVVTHILRGQIY